MGRIFGKYYCISKSLGMKSGVNAKASHILIDMKVHKFQIKKKKKERRKRKLKLKVFWHK
jgi:peptidyl-prolyl cis-trans isomerase D